MFGKEARRMSRVRHREAGEVDEGEFSCDSASIIITTDVRLPTLVVEYPLLLVLSRRR